MTDSHMKHLKQAVVNLGVAVTEASRLMAEAMKPAIEAIDTIFRPKSPEERFKRWGVDGLDLDNPVDRWVYQKHILSTPLRALRDFWEWIQARL